MMLVCIPSLSSRGNTQVGQLSFEEILMLDSIQIEPEAISKNAVKLCLLVVARGGGS